MVSILYATIMGIIQGITEWLPISSSGHLVIFQHLFQQPSDLFLDLMLHYGSLLVLLLVFYKDITKMLLSIFFKKYKGYRRYLYLIVIGSVPTAIIGFLFHDVAESLFSSLFAVSISLIITGSLLYLTKYAAPNAADNNTIKSFIIGIVQGIAIIPGISRSGSTISTGMLLGLGRKDSARFSFLLAIPALLGAALYETETSPNLVLDSAYLLPILIGTIVSVIVGYIALKYLLTLINKGRFYKFSYYCWFVGLIFLIVSLI